MKKESKYPDLTENEVANLCAEPQVNEERIIEALQKTWDYVGNEVINLSGDVAVERDVVIETTVDRIYMFDKEASRTLMKMSSDKVKEIATKAFPLESYGY